MKRTGQSKIAVVGWGRGMGHTGHMYLASAVITQAKMMHADPYFFVSKTVGKDDPLFPEEKIKIYQRVFPQYATIFTAEGNLNEALTQLANEGYVGVVVVVGADQKNAFQYLEKPNKEGVPVYQSMGLQKLKVISRQETKDKYAQEEGPRATPMREILLQPDATEEQKYQVWRRDMPKALSDKEVMDLMRKAEARLLGAVKTKKLKEFIERIKPLLPTMSNDRKQKVYSLIESALKDKADLDAKRKALQDLEREPGVDQEAIRQRKLDLEKEARTKGVEEDISRRGILKGIAGAGLAGAAGKASGIAGAFPTPSHQQAMYKAAADSNAAQARADAAEKAKQDAKRIQKGTQDIERLNQVNYHGKNAPIQTDAEWDGDSSFMYLNGIQLNMASRMPIRGDVPSSLKLIVTKEGRQVYIWTRSGLKGVMGYYFYPADNPKTINELESDDLEEGSKYKCSCHPGDPDPDCPVHGLEPMEVGDALDVKEGDFTKTPSGDYRNMHTGRSSSTAPAQKKKRGQKTGAEWDAIEKAKKEQGLNEFAPGNGDDDDHYAEYVVYQCDPNDEFEFIGGPLYQSDNLGMAHKYAYEHFLRYRPKAFVIYQPHTEASRGHYGVKDERGIIEDYVDE